MQDKNTWSLRLLPPYIFIAVGKLVGHLLGLRGKAYKFWDQNHQEIKSVLPSAAEWFCKHLRSTVSLQVSSQCASYPCQTATITYFTFSQNSYYHLAGGVFYLLICLSLPVECKLSESMNFVCLLLFLPGPRTMTALSRCLIHAY